MKFFVDTDRTHLVYSQLINEFRKKRFPFDNRLVRPQDLVDMTYIPEREQIWFWFTLCYWMKGPINSNDVTKKLCALFLKRRELFDPHVVSTLRVSELSKIISKDVLDFTPELIAKAWIKNSQKLVQHFDGDLTNLYRMANYDNDAVVHTIRNNDKEGLPKEAPGFTGFFGFQYKMASMITYFLVEQNLIPQFPFIAAVDFHLCRIALVSRVVTPESFTYGIAFGYPEALQDAVRQSLVLFTNMNQTDMIDLADAMWLLSGNLCISSPVNSQPDQAEWRKEARQLSRLRNGKERDSDQKPPELFKRFSGFNQLGWLATGKQEARIRATCWRCPIADHCSHGCPSGTYYNAANGPDERGIMLVERPAIPKCPRG